ncbi:MAG TPA: hypothetical protein VGH35_12385 [Gaiellaceae bacterium]
MTKSRGALAAFASGFLVCIALLAWASHDRPTLRIDATFSPGACCSWQAWLGGTPNGEEHVLPIRPGRTTYDVPVHDRRLNRLFLTLGPRAHGAFRVHRVWLARGGRTVDQLTIPAARAQRSVDLPASLDAHESHVRLVLSNVRDERLRYVAGLLLAGSLVILLVCLDWRRQWPIAAALAATILVTRALPSLSVRLHLHDDVSRAVGGATWSGEWKTRERAVVELAALVAAVAGLGIPLATRRWWRRADAAEEPADARPTGAQGAALVGVPIAIVALFGAPNLRDLLGRGPVYTPGFDSDNFLFWQYLIRAKHLRPIEDFYWLYGFQWLSHLSLPWGAVIAYAWSLGFWSLLAAGTYLSLRRFFSGGSFLVRYVLLSAFWLTALLTSDFPFATRYVSALAVVLLFVGIDPRRDALLAWRRALFGLALFAAVLFEPAQAVYALVAIAVFAVCELVADRTEVGGIVRRTLATIAAPAALGVLVYWLLDSVSGSIDVYRSFLLASSAYARPGQVDGWVVHPTTLASFVFWAMPLTVALGLSGFMVASRRARLPYAAAAALGVLSLMMMQKQALRPDTSNMSSEIWLPVLYGLAFWTVGNTALAARRYRVALPALAGVLLAIVLLSGGLNDAAHRVVHGPARMVASAKALVTDEGAFGDQQRHQFDRSRFVRYADYLPVVRALGRTPSVRRGGHVWILGDETPIVIMLGQGWPYYMTDMYDSSPIFLQQKILRRLEAHPPARVVWHFDPRYLSWDDVPTPVRVPLLYTWAVHNLVPSERRGQFEILAPRKKGMPVDLAFWRRRIGAGLDLGRIPAVARVSGGPCRGKPCSPFVVVHFEQGAAKPDRVTLPVEVNGLRFAVTFATGPESTYVVPLERAWFWAASPDARRRILPVTLPGASVDVVRRAPDDHVLY